MDVVAVLLPHDVHARFATEALEAGHHVVVEKPMATTLADCDAMMAVRGAGPGSVCTRCTIASTIPPARPFRPSSPRGAIGDVFLAQTVGLEPPQTVSVRPWLGTLTWGGRVLLAQAVHPAYVLRWLLGDVTEVACLTSENGKVVYMTAEDTAVALLRFRSGVVGEMTGTFGLRAGPYEHGITLYGPEGYVEIHSRRGVQAIAPRRFDDREPTP